MQRFSAVVDREFSGGRAAGQPRVSISKGLNRFIWDTRHPTVSQIPGLPPVNIKPFAKPGTYQVRLTVDGKSQTQSFELNINPNEKYSRQETDRKGKAWMELQAKAEEGVQAVLRAHAAKEKVAGASKDPAISHPRPQPSTSSAPISNPPWYRRARPWSRSSASPRRPWPS